MFALTAEKNKGRSRQNRLEESGAVMAMSKQPRFARRMFRFVHRLFNGSVTPPRGAALMATAALFTFTSVTGAILGGHVPAVVQWSAGVTGFTVQEVRVVGNVQTSEIDVVGALGLNGWYTLVGFPPEQARERLTQLPWVSDASVRKIYPATLEVKLAERKAFAIWQQDENVMLIQRDGTLIEPYGHAHLAHLPLVIGKGARAKAFSFVQGMKRHHELYKQIKAYIRVGDRRWDLRLENGVTIKLPEKAPMLAVDRLLGLDHETQLLARNVKSIDMRFEDRLFLQVPQTVLDERQEELELRNERHKT